MTEDDITKSSIDSPWLRDGLLQTDHLNNIGTKMTFSAGSLVYNLGDPVTYFYYIIEGQVKIFINNQCGDERTICIVESGNFFGEAAFLDEKNRFASAIALKDCQVLALDRRALDIIFRQQPEMVWLIFKSVSRKMRLLTFQLEDMTFWSVEKRLCRFLLKLLGDFSLHTEKGLCLSIILTDDQLGQHIGARREAVTRALGRLRAQGLVRKENRRLYFPDLSLFKEYM